MDNIILDVIESYNEYLKKLKNSIPDFINLLKESTISDSKLLIIDLMEGLIWMKDVNIKLNSLINSSTEDINDMNMLIEELANATELGDINHSIEVINYEIIPLIDSLNCIDV